jgi:hypothetical protein
MEIFVRKMGRIALDLNGKRFGMLVATNTLRRRPDLPFDTFMQWIQKLKERCHG